MQAPDGGWWLGTTRGVYRLAGPKWELVGEQPGPLQFPVNGLAVVGGTLWAAAESGLWAQKVDGWEAHAPDPGQERGPVRALTAADPCGLWLACGDGLRRYDPRERRATVACTPADSGLAGNQVTGLAESGGALWVATRCGISRLSLG